MEICVAAHVSPKKRAKGGWLSDDCCQGHYTRCSNNGGVGVEGYYRPPAMIVDRPHHLRVGDDVELGEVEEEGEEVDFVDNNPLVEGGGVDDMLELPCTRKTLVHRPLKDVDGADVRAHEQPEVLGFSHEFDIGEVPV
jgi:hypothetical protein